MTVAILGSQQIVSAAGGALSVPVGTTLALVFGGGAAPNAGVVSSAVDSLTIGGRELAKTQIDSGSTPWRSGCVAGYLVDPPSGAQALVITYTDAPWDSLGPIFGVVYLAGLNLTFRDVALARDLNFGGTNNLTVHSQSADQVLGYLNTFGAPPPTPAGTTSLDVVGSSSLFGRTVSFDAPGAESTAMSFSGDFPFSSLVSICEANDRGLLAAA
jgi:hypothetical protein